MRAILFPIELINTLVLILQEDGLILVSQTSTRPSILQTNVQHLDVYLPLVCSAATKSLDTEVALVWGC
jgi:hypothetical protein